MTIHQSEAEDWRVTLVETGMETQTGGRLKRIRRYLGEDALFCMTYGDAVGDIDVASLLEFHISHGKLATVTAVRPLARFGALHLNGARVDRFKEKPAGEGGLINGGFFVLSPRALDFIDEDLTFWEREPMERLATRGELMAYRHHGFWQPMDTLRDRVLLDRLCEERRAPWMTWRDGGR
jgi:glucose-1-phosphate cytidylyltransferase